MKMEKSAIQESSSKTFTSLSRFLVFSSVQNAETRFFVILVDAAAFTFTLHNGNYTHTPYTIKHTEEDVGFIGDEEKEQN